MPIKIKCGHSRSAPACDLYAFLVTVQSSKLSILVSVLLLGVLALLPLPPANGRSFGLALGLPAI